MLLKREDLDQTWRCLWQGLSTLKLIRTTLPIAVILLGSAHLVWSRRY